MALETPTYISDLNPANPPAGDPAAQGADHLRNIKAALKATFPNITGAMTLTHTVINGLPAAISAALTSAQTYATTAVANATASLTSAINTEASNRAAAVAAEATTRETRVNDVYNAMVTAVNNEAAVRNSQDGNILAVFGQYLSLAGIRVTVLSGNRSYITLPIQTANGNGAVVSNNTLIIAMGQGIGASWGNAVAYGPGFSQLFSLVITPARNDGSTIGFWYNDGGSFLAWPRDVAGNPASSDFDYIAIGLA